MKKFCFFLLLAAVLLSLCACQKNETKAPAPAPAEPTAEPAPAPTARPPFVPEGNAMLGDSFHRAADGTLYSSILPLDGSVYVPEELLGGQFSYIAAVLTDGETLYFTAKPNPMSDEPTALYALDMNSGETRLLAEDGARSTRIALVDSVLLYNSADGLRAIDPATGEQTAFLEGKVSILDAFGGWIFYLRDGEDTLLRNCADLSAETTLCPLPVNSRLSAAAGSLAIVCPKADGSAMVLRICDWYGETLSETELGSEGPLLYNGGEELFLLYPFAGEIVVHDRLSGSELRRVPFAGELSQVNVYDISDHGIFYQGLDSNGDYVCWRMDPDGENAGPVAE